MSNRRLSVRKIKEILRLKLGCGISEREIARSCGVSRSTVADYLRRAAAAKMTWGEASAMAEPSSKSVCFLPSTCRARSNARRRTASTSTASCVPTVKFNLTLSQLWLEYKAYILTATNTLSFASITGAGGKSSITA